MGEKTIHIICGPTASGKSALAIRRAQEIGGAIVNCDSRQIYDGLPLLTAQPSAEDRKQAPHHLYGCVHPDDAVSAGSWRDMAMPLIGNLLDDGIAPIVTGGNGLYIKTLIEGISPIPQVPADIRAAAVAEQQRLGNPAFHAALERRDPDTAAQYHPMHTARLVHAWEVLEATGTPLAAWQRLPRQGPPDDWMFDITIVQPPRDNLYQRCNDRFLQMLDMGAEEELAAFDAQVAQGNISKDAILTKTVGAEPLRRHRRREIALAEAIDLAQTETRQYAKRQTTWFNNQVKASMNIVHIKKIL